MKKISFLIITVIFFSGCDNSSDPKIEEPQKLFVETLSSEVQENILWVADVEEDDLSDWEDAGTNDYYSGGGIFITDPSNSFHGLTTQYARSGKQSCYASIQNAYRAQNGNKAVRYMRWTDKAWNDGGEYFPSAAYYSVWVYFPHDYNPNKYQPWDPGDGGWWNFFQFKSDDADGVSQPVWVLNVDHNDDEGSMYLYLYSKYNSPNSFNQSSPLPLPSKEWVHIEAYYDQKNDGTGKIIIWQNGVEILRAENVDTYLSQNITWGIGNYADHIAGGPVEGEATLYFDDAIVASVKICDHIGK